MADFGCLSDTDESAVDDVTSQAQDLCVLEQLSAINCSAFTHSVLPSELDSRFRRLKSLPVPLTQKTNQISDKDYMSDYKPSDSPHRNDPLIPKHSSSSPVSISDSFLQNSSFSPLKSKSRSTSNSRSFASSLPLDSSSPKKGGCFRCFPRRLSKKHKMENRVLDTAFDSDEFPSGLATFSVKQQQKMLNKAIKEQDKVSQEAEKIVNWAKQASGRMNSHGVEDELSSSNDEPAN